MTRGTSRGQRRPMGFALVSAVAWLLAGGCEADHGASTDELAAGEAGEFGASLAGRGQGATSDGGTSNGAPQGGERAGGASPGEGGASPSVGGAPPSDGGVRAGDGGAAGAGGAPNLLPGQCFTTGQCAPDEMCEGGQLEPLCVLEREGGVCSDFEYKDAAGHCLKLPGFCEPCLANGNCGFPEPGSPDYYYGGPGYYCNAQRRCVGPLGESERCSSDAQCRFPGVPVWKMGCAGTLGGNGCGLLSNDCEENGCSAGYCTMDGGYPDGCTPYGGCDINQNFCAPGSHCVITAAPYGTCEPSPGMGEACANVINCFWPGCDKQACANGLVCKSGICSDPRPICGTHGYCPVGETCAMGHVLGECVKDPNFANAADGGAGGASACSR